MQTKSKKRFKTLLVAGISTVVVLGTASTIPFMFHQEETNSSRMTLKPGGTELTQEQEAIMHIKDNLFANLSKSNLKFDDLLLKVKGLGGSEKELRVSFSGAVDYLAFMQGHETNDTSDDAIAKFNGRVNAKYLDNAQDAKYPVQLDEDLRLQSQGTGKLYIDWYEQKYTISGKIIDDVLDFLPVINEDFSQFKDIFNEVKSMDITSLIPMAMNVIGSLSSDSDLDQIPEFVNGKNIYTFTFVIGQDLLSQANIDIDEIKLSLKCDEDGLLTAITLDEIEISGIKVSLDGKTEMNLDVNSPYVEDIEDSEYTNNLDCTTNILTTVGSLINEKKFSTKYTLSLNESQNGVRIANHNFEGTIAGDVSAFKDTDEEGNKIEGNRFVDGAIYSFTMDRNADFGNQINVRHQNSTTYFDINNNIKAKIENSTITDLIETIGKETGEVDTSKALDAINEVISTDVIYELIDGHWSAYKQFIKSLTVSDEVLCVTLNAKVFNLPDSDFYLKIDLSNGKLNGLAIEDLPFRFITKANGLEYLDTCSFNLELQDFIELDEIIDSNYASMQIVSPIANTVLKVVDEKKAKLQYEFEWENEDSKSYALAGNINADLTTANEFSSFDLNDPLASLKDFNLGTYSVSASTRINSVSHNLKVNYQDQGLYLDYYGYDENHARTRISFKQQTLLNLYDSIDALIGNSTQNNEENDSIFNVSDTLLEDIIDFSDGEIWNIVKGDSIANVTQYIQLYNPQDSSALVVALDTQAFDKDYGIVYLTLDKDSHDLLNIDAKFDTSEFGNFKLKLQFGEYDESVIIPQEEIDNYYKEMDTTCDAIGKLLGGTKSNIEIDGSLSDNNNPSNGH